MKLAASDISSLIKLASEMPIGSDMRKAVLAGLQVQATDYDKVDRDFERGESVKLKGGWMVLVFPKGTRAPWDVAIETATVRIPHGDNGAEFIAYSGIPKYPYILNTEFGLAAALPHCVAHLYQKPVELDKADATKIVKLSRDAIAAGLGGIDGAGLQIWEHALMTGKAGNRLGQFHYFAVVKTAEGQSWQGTKDVYAAVSAYGKLGSTPKFVKIAEGDLHKMTQVARVKMKSKSGDYQQVDLKNVSHTRELWFAL